MEALADTDWLTNAGPPLFATILALAVMYGVYRVVHESWERSVRRDVAHGIIQVVLGLAGIVAVVLLLPVDEQTKENLLTAGGLFLTAIVGFSSTNVIKDGAAGITLRFIGSFRRGDYLCIGEYFGRISDIGFFHTELQNEDRSLVTLSNTRLISEPFEVFPSSGTMVKTRVSLGYDVPRSKVEQAMLEATEICGLTDPFVHVENLGNYAITYKVAGLLEETDALLTSRSDFRKEVIDALHRYDIEIVSPRFQNQRQYNADKRFIAEVRREPENTRITEADEIVFDKALKARKVEDLDDLVAELETQLEDGEDLGAATKSKIETRLAQIRQRKEKYEELLAKKD